MTLKYINIYLGGIMERLESYLSENYVKEKDQLNSVRELIEKVIPIYGQFNDKYGWPYILGKDLDKISTSTTAMVTFSMSVLMSGKYDLVIDERGDDFFSNNKHIKSSEGYVKTYKKSSELIFNIFKKNEFKFQSGTYGENDPFTLVWTRYLIDSDLTSGIEGYEEIKKNFDKTCSEKIIDIFKALYEHKESEKLSINIEKNHIFPLLKIVQLYFAMTSVSQKETTFFSEDKNNINKYVNEVKSTLNNRLHHHLSLASIENSNFDAAELAFSLEGLLLLDSNRKNFDQNLLNRVFKVIKDRQDISLYWRPLKPFVSNEQGLALLPLSVEIAMSLIRICRLLEKRGDILFSKNYEMFEKYTEWLKTRVTVVPCPEEVCDNCKNQEFCIKESTSKENKFFGWCSEHIYQPTVIHPWETSQVIVYLFNFYDMLQRHISNQSFKFANLSAKDCGNNKDEWANWKESEPVSVHGFKVYEEIGENYLALKDADEEGCYSMLLYGPPGTGKSTIAEKIAESKGWPLVTITPSDFIANGADQVETKAKSIFKVLEEQKNMVVLFDEIDRLILDRDSKSYSEQSDLFQFMTPSMLVKLKDLRTRKKIIFIIATNYAERIDMAIKRKGRIDNLYLVLPPDKRGREWLFKKLIIEKLDGNKEQWEKCKDFIIGKTAFFTFTEFKQLSKVIKKNNARLIEDGKVNKDELYKLIEKPAITLMSYNRKLGTTLQENNSQIPSKEFMSLVFIKAETIDCSIKASEIFNKHELALLIDFLGLKKTTGELNDRKLNVELGDVLKIPDLTNRINSYIDEEMTKKILMVLEEIIKSWDYELEENKC